MLLWGCKVHELVCEECKKRFKTYDKDQRFCCGRCEIQAKTTKPPADLFDFEG